mmetsp:Transcript_6426/g.20031  ORF Transcript_6426/g.20031 Transcript_6426/m.20031 type:complete len:434 (+) Transcript_6426:29-1330(+)
MRDQENSEDWCHRISPYKQATSNHNKTFAHNRCTQFGRHMTHVSQPFEVTNHAADASSNTNHVRRHKREGSEALAFCQAMRGQKAAAPQNARVASTRKCGQCGCPSGVQQLPPPREVLNRCDGTTGNAGNTSCLQDDRGILLLSGLSLLDLLSTREGSRKWRGWQLLKVKGQLRNLLRRHLEGGIVIKATTTLAARAAARDLLGLLLFRKLDVRLHREANPPLVIERNDTHLHLLTLRKDILNRLDAALLNLRDVEQAIHAFLQVDEGPERLDRAHGASDELLLVSVLELGEVDAFTFLPTAAARAARRLDVRVLVRERNLLLFQINALHTDSHGIALRKHVIGVLHESVRHLRNMEQTISGVTDVDEGTVLLDGANSALNHRADLKLLDRQLLGTRLACLRRLLVCRRHVRRRLCRITHGESPSGARRGGDA